MLGQPLALRGIALNVDSFTNGISPEETEAAFSVMMFYAGVSLKPPK